MKIKINPLYFYIQALHVINIYHALSSTISDHKKPSFITTFIHNNLKRFTSGSGSFRSLVSFSGALSRMAHHRAESHCVHTKPKQRASHWRNKGWGSDNCSKQIEIMFPFKQASCTINEINKNNVNVSQLYC